MGEEEEKRRRAADRFWEERRILIIADCERHSFSTDVVLRRLDRDRKWQERGEMLRGRSKGTNELEERAHTMLVKAAHESEIANSHPSRWPSMFEGDPVLLTVSRDEADARAKEAKQRLDDLVATLTSLGIDFGIWCGWVPGASGHCLGIPSPSSRDTVSGPCQSVDPWARVCECEVRLCTLMCLCENDPYVSCEGPDNVWWGLCTSAVCTRVVS